MAIVLTGDQYGKAENRIVRIYRDTPRHEIRDINVTTRLQGDFAAAYTDGDQSKVLPTDSQKQTAYAYAKEKGIASIEQYALALARHFVEDIEPVHRARIDVEEYAWDRVNEHTWVRKGQEIRTAVVTFDESGASVTGGVKDLTILKSTDSEFAGFLEDPYTVLEPTHDRMLATSLVATWRFTTTDVDWNDAYAGIRELLVQTFAGHHSLALQQTLFAMGKAILEEFPVIEEVNLVAPNKHHFLYDLSRFGLENPGEVFNPDDRPYGVIQATVGRSAH
jgi:urate oxidase